MSEEWQKVSIPDYVKYIGQEKEIASLKVQLKREMDCVDKIIHKDEGYEDYKYGVHELTKFAIETVKARAREQVNES